MKVSKLVTLVLVFVLAVNLFSACGRQERQPENTSSSQENSIQNQSDNSNRQDGDAIEGPDYLNAEGFPIVKEPITLKMMGARALTHSEWNDMEIWKEYEKMTGIHVEFNTPPDNAWNEKKNLAFASGDLPDAFIRGSLSGKDVVTYGMQQKIIIPLKDLIDKYGHNIKKTFEKFPDAQKNLTAPDGEIYTLPQIQDHKPIRSNPKPFINEKWLNELGLSMPVTVDDLYEVLKAFKERDPNRNGEKDEIPFSSGDVNGIITMFRGYWGLGNRGTWAGTFGLKNIDLGSDGKVRYIPIDPEYKEVLEYLNKLYTEGLIDQEIVTHTAADFRAKGAQGIFGAFLSADPLTVATDKYVDMYNYMPVLKASDDIQPIYGASMPITPNIGVFAITKINEHPEATLRWVDYFFSDEGTRFARMGIEGVTYEQLPDGSYDYVDSVKNDPRGIREAIGEFTPFTDGQMPQINQVAYDKTPNTLPICIEAAESYVPYMPEEVWPQFIFTLEEQEILERIEVDVSTYIQEMQTKFITGNEPLSNWDNYVNEIEKRGIDKVIEVYQAAYERWKDA